MNSFAFFVATLKFDSSDVFVLGICESNLKAEAIRHHLQKCCGCKPTAKDAHVSAMTVDNWRAVCSVNSSPIYIDLDGEM